MAAAVSSHQSVFNIFDMPREVAPLQQLDLLPERKQIHEVLCGRERPSHVTYSRADGQAALAQLATLLRAQNLTDVAHNAEAPLPSTRALNSSPTPSLPEVLTDPLRPAHVTFSRTKGAAALQQLRIIIKDEPSIGQPNAPATPHADQAHEPLADLFTLSKEPAAPVDLTHKPLADLFASSEDPAREAQVTETDAKESQAKEPQVKLAPPQEEQDHDVDADAPAPASARAVHVLLTGVLTGAVVCAAVVEALAHALLFLWGANPLQEIHRLGVYSALMLRHAPPTVAKSLIRALADLWTHQGHPSRVFKANDPWALANTLNYDKVAHYSCQMVFTKPFDDRAKLEALLLELAEEVGIAREDALLVFKDDEPLRSSFDEGRPGLSGDHYAGKLGSNFKVYGRDYKDYKVAIVVYDTVAADGTGAGTTVVHAHLPGRAYDGTSCFNFLKELISRYCGNQPYPVAQGHQRTHLTDEAAQALDNKWALAAFLLKLPWFVFTNLSATTWDKASTQAGFPQRREGVREMCILNLSAAESKQLARALKQHPDGKTAPTAGLLFAAVTAYRKVLGEYPHCVPIQASLQTRACAPAFPERRFVGDWLIAPLHHVRSWPRELKARAAALVAPVLAALTGTTVHPPTTHYYQLKDAQDAYDTLLAELGSQQGQVRTAFLARVLGVVKGGAAAFEKAPTYAHDNRLADSLFFNNYGKREVDPRSGAVSFNWSGAGRVNCNAILLNGRICIVFASSTLGLPTVQRIRDQAHREIQRMAASA